MIRTPFLALGMLCLFASASAATSAKDSFAKLKTLQGTWIGSAGKNKEIGATSVVYKLTWAGSALVETLFPGTDHEMMTVYHLDGPSLMMTHYCAGQNQPTMKLVPGKSPDALEFNFVSGSNMKPGDVHMHHLKMKFLSSNHLVSEWTSFSNGVPFGTAKFDLQRAKTKA